jgi:hypothetical protein
MKKEITINTDQGKVTLSFSSSPLTAKEVTLVNSEAYVYELRTNSENAIPPLSRNVAKKVTAVSIPSNYEIRM